MRKVRIYSIFSVPGLILCLLLFTPNALAHTVNYNTRPRVAVHATRIQPDGWQRKRPSNHKRNRWDWWNNGNWGNNDNWNNGNWGNGNWRNNGNWGNGNRRNNGNWRNNSNWNNGNWRNNGGFPGNWNGNPQDNNGGRDPGGDNQG